MHETGATVTAERHLRWGWWTLFAFAGLGLGLESLHALRVGFYLDVGQDTRRLMFTLAHAHGTLLGLVHLAFAWTLTTNVGRAIAASPWPSRGLACASVLLPLGFFAGGVVIHDGEPGLGVVLVPVGATIFLGTLLSIALTLTRSPER